MIIIISNNHHHHLWKYTYLIDKQKAVPPSSKFCIAYRIFSLWYWNVLISPKDLLVKYFITETVLKSFVSQRMKANIMLHQVYINNLSVLSFNYKWLNFIYAYYSGKCGVEFTSFTSYLINFRNVIMLKSLALYPQVLCYFYQDNISK